MTTDLNPCPVCNGTGEIENEIVHCCNCGRINADIDCATCKGKGTIRPTQDPRYLFWCARLYEVNQIQANAWNIGQISQYDRASNVKKDIEVRLWKIELNKSRRTTAKGRKPA